MKHLRKIVCWLGSDWRLPFVGLAAVGLVFVMSGGLFQFAVEVHSAYLQAKAERDTKAAVEYLHALHDEIVRERAKQNAPQLADVMRATP